MYLRMLAAPQRLPGSSGFDGEASLGCFAGSGLGGSPEAPWKRRQTGRDDGGFLESSSRRPERTWSTALRSSS